MSTLVFLSILVLITGVATSSIFINDVYADSGQKVKKYLETLEKEKAAKAAEEAAKKAAEEAAKKAAEEAAKKAAEEAAKKAAEEAAKKAAEEAAKAEAEKPDTTESTTEEVTDPVVEEVTDPVVEEVTEPVVEEVTDPVVEEETETTTEEETQSNSDNSSGSGNSNENNNPSNDEQTPPVTTTDEEQPQTEDSPNDKVTNENDLSIVVTKVEAASTGKMVYISGSGAEESTKLTVEIKTAVDEKEIVELKIRSNSVGEFSTVWIKGGDIESNAFTIRAEDRVGDNDKITFTITESGFETGLIEDEPVDTPQNTPNDDSGSIDLPQVDPNLGLEEKVSFLEGLVSAMQGIITSLSIALENYQTQLDAEASAREAADTAIQNQIMILSKPEIVSYQREILITVLPGEQSYHSITCPDGNLAQSGGIDILTEQIPKFKTFANHMEGSNGWTVESVNNHESESVDMTLYVNCLKIEISQEDQPEIAPAITVEETSP